jgi:tetratricopeptide (TPR) repeat protein
MLGLKVICETRLGDLAAAAQTSSAALASAEKVGEDDLLGRTLTNVSAFYTETGDFARAAQLLDQQLTINRRNGNIEGEVVGLSNLGYAYILMGMPEKAIPALQRCIEWHRPLGIDFSCLWKSEPFLAYIRYDDALSALKSWNEACRLKTKR